MEAVVVDRDGPVCRVSLNRPEKLNALNEAVRSGLHAAFTELADSPDVKVVVLGGRGRAFTAGADLARRADGPGEEPHGDGPSWATRRHAFGSWQRLLDLIERVPQVTVARLHGHCVGGGVLLAAACDIRVADDTLSARIPELAIGIPLTWNGVPRLAREIGLPMTRDLVMTGRTMGAAEAKACGFVQRLAGTGELDAAVDEVVEELLGMPAGPLAMTKALTSALGRQMAGEVGWADPDLLMWSPTEAESTQAAVDYVSRRLRKAP